MSVLNLTHSLTLLLSKLWRLSSLRCVLQAPSHLLLLLLKTLLCQVDHAIEEMSTGVLVKKDFSESGSFGRYLVFLSSVRTFQEGAPEACRTILQELHDTLQVSQVIRRFLPLRLNFLRFLKGLLRCRTNHRDRWSYFTCGDGTSNEVLQRSGGGVVGFRSWHFPHLRYHCTLSSTAASHILFLYFVPYHSHPLRSLRHGLLRTTFSICNL